MNPLKDSVILITGGTGSFGNRVAAHLSTLQPREVRIFSRDEKKQSDMQLLSPHYRYILGDVRDESRVAEATKGVDYVFHAAALKQVPACEQHPTEAIRTNILGSMNLCSAAIKAGVRTVVALSTDKAVKPINVMGTSKAMMEKIVCSQNQLHSETVFCCVRYGNVMGSRGSVIPLFEKQARTGIPLTITAPQMTRFLMTLDQSVDLVLHAMTHAKGGEIFVRKAPASTVIDLAKAVSLRSSPRGLDHPLSVTGIRPGEKLHEVLVNEYEMQRVTEKTEYFAIYPEYRLPDNLSSQQLGLEYTSENTRQLSDMDSLIGLLESMGTTDNYT